MNSIDLYAVRKIVAALILSVLLPSIVGAEESWLGLGESMDLG